MNWIIPAKYQLHLTTLTIALCLAAACASEIGATADTERCGELEAHLAKCGLSVAAASESKNCDGAGVLLAMDCDELTTAVNQIDTKADGSWFDFNRGYWQSCSYDFQCDEAANLFCEASLCTRGCVVDPCEGPGEVCREAEVTNHWYCLPPAELGERCSLDDACAEGLVCMWSNNSRQKECSPVSQENHACGKDEHCADGLFCLPLWYDDRIDGHRVWNYAERCVPTQDENNYCWKDEHCNDGRVCRPTGDWGYAKRSCVSPGVRGDWCYDADHHCADDLVCRPFNDNYRHRRHHQCAPMAHRGETCRTSDQCEADLFCWKRRCRESLQAGERCGDGARCDEGLVCRPPPRQTRRRDPECLPPL